MQQAGTPCPSEHKGPQSLPESFFSAASTRRFRAARHLTYKVLPPQTTR